MTMARNAAVTACVSGKTTSKTRMLALSSALISVLVFLWTWKTYG